MESIIRWHPFPDGNKRTALLTAHHFLAKNGYYMVVPLDVVRFMVDVAQYETDTEEEIDRLVNRIAEWLEIRTATDDEEYGAIYAKYITNPVRKMVLLMFTGVGIIYAWRKLNRWLASDTHPEYAKNLQQTWTFLFLMMRHAEQMKKRKDGDSAD